LEGVDYVAICTGASTQKIPILKNNFIKSVRMASEFLMSIHLEKNLPHFAIRSPIIVIGGGLTAIDSATEAKAYYELRNPGKNAEVTICYRSNIENSMAYKQNAEEIRNALAEGVKIIGNMDAAEFIPDTDGNVRQVKFKNGILMDAGTVLLAVGTESDINYINRTQQAYKGRIGYFGDANPSYRGSVVKAIASVKDAYYKVHEYLMSCSNSQHCISPDSYSKPLCLLDEKFDGLSSIVKSYDKISELEWELVIASPFAAANYKIGQYFKLQKYGTDNAIAVTCIKQYESLLYFRMRNNKMHFDIGERIALMGPLGTSLLEHIRKNDTVVTDNHDLYIELSKHSIHTLKLDEANTEEILSAHLVIISNYANIGKVDFVNRDKVMIPVYLPFKCMMGGICGACICKIDDSFGYGCLSNYVLISKIDMQHNKERLLQDKQNV
jgi:hypothetical protein